ncbi:unnamed protein product [Closterium sp. NIES-53]
MVSGMSDGDLRTGGGKVVRGDWGKRGIGVDGFKALRLHKTHAESLCYPRLACPPHPHPPSPLPPPPPFPLFSHPVAFP